MKLVPKTAIQNDSKTAFVPSPHPSIISDEAYNLPTEEEKIRAAIIEYLNKSEFLKHTPELDAFIEELIAIPMDAHTFNMYKKSFNKRGPYYSDLEIKIMPKRSMVLHGATMFQSKTEDPETILDRLFILYNSGERRWKYKERMEKERKAKEEQESLKKQG